jgi:hypothetical protein
MGGPAEVGAVRTALGETFAMIAAARVLCGAAAGTALLIAGATMEPAGAQDDACKAGYVNATGRGKWRPFSRGKELEGNGAAMRDAVAAWEREVAATHGDRWKQWDLAVGKSHECGITQGRVLNNLVQCTIKGRPCAAPERGAAPAVVDVPERGNGRDRGDRDDDRRTRYGSRSWRYQIEMRHQERLAEWRRRREDWAWRREEARQRYLQARRDGTEARARARADARERYLARWRD